VPSIAWRSRPSIDKLMRGSAEDGEGRAGAVPEPPPRTAVPPVRPDHGSAGACGAAAVRDSPSDNGRSLRRQLPAARAALIHFLGTAGMVLLFAVFMLAQREDLRNDSPSDQPRDRRARRRRSNEASKRIGRYLAAPGHVNGTFGTASTGGPI